MTIMHKIEGAKLWDFGEYLVYAKTKEHAENQLKRYFAFLDELGEDIKNRGSIAKARKDE